MPDSCETHRAIENKPLTIEERETLDLAYKNVIGRRIVSSRHLMENSTGSDDRVKGYREKSDSELAKICEDIL